MLTAGTEWDRSKFIISGSTYLFRWDRIDFPFERSLRAQRHPMWHIWQSKIVVCQQIWSTGCMQELQSKEVKHILMYFVFLEVIFLQNITIEKKNKTKTIQCSTLKQYSEVWCGNLNYSFLHTYWILCLFRKNSPLLM